MGQANPGWGFQPDAMRPDVEVRRAKPMEHCDVRQECAREIHPDRRRELFRAVSRERPEPLQLAASLKHLPVLNRLLNVCVAWSKKDILKVGLPLDQVRNDAALAARDLFSSLRTGIARDLSEIPDPEQAGRAVLSGILRVVPRYRSSADARKLCRRWPHSRRTACAAAESSLRRCQKTRIALSATEYPEGLAD